MGAVIGVLGFLLYTNTLNNGYVLDDFSAIKENNIVRQGTHGIKEIFQTSYRQGYLSVKDGLYRPLSLAVFALEWEFFPDQPGIAHFVNIVLYALTGLLLFLVLCRMFGSGENPRRGEAAAFIASLLFITHPLHVEVTANIKSMDEMLCFFFVLCSFLFAFRFAETDKNKFMFFGVITYFLSLLSKETSITFLALVPIALHFFTPVKILRNIFITFMFLAAAGIYLFIRWKVLHGFSDTGVSMADNIVESARKTLNTHIGTAFYILGLYISKLIFPSTLSYDYSFNEIPIVGMGNWFSILSFLFYLAAGVYAAVMLYKSFKKNKDTPLLNNESKIISFGIFFFLITIFLFSNLAIIIGTSMGDRLMYFPSMGFCIVIAAMLVKVLKIDSINTEKIFSNVKLVPVLIIVILFSVKLYSRNPEWQDNYTLYSHDVNIVPNSVKAHYYLGLELVKVKAEEEKDEQKKKKVLEQGIDELEKAVKIHPTFAGAYTEMGVAYYKMKNYEMAIYNYNKADSLNPADAISLNNVGTIYFQWGKYQEAKEKFQKALQVDGRFIDAHMNLGSVLGTMGDYQGAIASFQNAIHYAPDNANAYYFIALTYSNMKDEAGADKYFAIAHQMNSNLQKPANK